MRSTADEPLVELETDKVTVEVPAPAAGVLADIKVAQGTTVAVGSVLGSISEGAGAAAKPRASARAAARPITTPLGEPSRQPNRLRRQARPRAPPAAPPQPCRGPRPGATCRRRPPPAR